MFVARYSGIEWSEAIKRATDFQADSCVLDWIDCLIAEGLLSSAVSARKIMINATEVISAPGAAMKKPYGPLLLGKTLPIAMKSGPKLAQTGKKGFNISGSPQHQGVLFSHRPERFKNQSFASELFKNKSKTSGRGIRNRTGTSC